MRGSQWQSRKEKYLHPNRRIINTVAKEHERRSEDINILGGASCV